LQWLRSEHRFLCRRVSTTVSRLSPVPSREGQRRHWRDDALDSGRNFTPGRQKSLGARGAPACAALAGQSRGLLTAQDGRPNISQVDLDAKRRPVWQRALTQCGALKPRSLPSVRTGQPCRSPYRVGTRLAKRISDPRGVDAFGPSIALLSRGRRRICAAHVRIPGPRRAGRSGVDTNASTLAALVSQNTGATRFTSAGQVRRSPPQSQVSR